METGYHLDVLDGQLAAEKNGKILSVVVDSADGNPIVQTSRDFFAGMLPPGTFQEGCPIDRFSEDSWCLVSCNAGYKQNEVRNHWCPAFFREQLSPEILPHLTVKGPRSWKQKLKDLNSDLEAMNGIDEGDKEEADEALRQDLLCQIDELKSWIDFFGRCMEANVVPVRVPGDGNCMVWSIRVLLMGWDHVEKISHGSKEGREEHNEIRESLNRGKRWPESLFGSYFFNIFAPRMELQMLSKHRPEKMFPSKTREPSP